MHAELPILNKIILQHAFDYFIKHHVLGLLVVLSFKLTQWEQY